MVEYREIKGFLGYRAGSDGTIWTCRIRGHKKGFKNEWRQLRFSTGKNNDYYQVSLHADKPYKKLVHRLILEAFKGSCPPGMECCHNDGNVNNNHIDNLRWDTRSNNHADKVAHGTHNKGERNVTAKLRDSNIIEIFKLKKDGYTISQIGDIFGVTETNIYPIINRRTWRHIHIPEELLVAPPLDSATETT